MYSFHQVIKAICQFSHPQDYGYVIFTQYPDKTLIELNLKNLPSGKHGFHVHQTADLRKGCESLGPHYNPFHGLHGDINKPGNHLGDLGNITVNENGECQMTLSVDILPLVGKHGIIGRSLVIHSGEDDLGKGNNEESLKSGNSGNRIACGIIGYM